MRYTHRSKFLIEADKILVTRDLDRREEYVLNSVRKPRKLFAAAFLVVLLFLAVAAYLVGCSHD